jgi:hypothetical protein
MNKVHTFKLLLLFLFILFLANFSLAQKEFTIKDGSKKYTAKISVDNFINNDCSGFGTISLYYKSSNDLFQTLKSDNLCFYVEGDANPTVNVIELYGEQSPLIFDDFNFDGFEDLAVSNGNNGSYGMPSYDVYVFNPAAKQFILNPQLTKLASTNLGMFKTDGQKKIITAFNKSGCCWHITTGYAVLNNNLVKVYELVEDATGDAGYVIVTEKKLEYGVWYTDVKKVKTEDYYK